MRGERAYSQAHLLSQARHGADQDPVNHASSYLVWEKLHLP
jgi:hypothetical protein